LAISSKFEGVLEQVLFVFCLAGAIAPNLPERIHLTLAVLFVPSFLVLLHEIYRLDARIGGVEWCQEGDEA